ncbi:tRNA dimethylallyltransferase 2 isoform X3 [Amaranthus tricolor]|uniref:tRNA dimethylallyltransferase 2 isoform X3 n=1 Tax=Amaranthus tricolor TaxID=29722 RepID=UPI00258BAD36|nr:tRNA dimethylallyltransferase 2 isoform X3 [Amaranthus tricolor]
MSDENEIETMINPHYPSNGSNLVDDKEEMEDGAVAISLTKKLQNPNNGEEEIKPKIVVIMGPTGSGKSKLAIDLATQFPIEIINADSMQVYHGLDVLTNKVTIFEQKGVPHHLLGTISPNVEFTSKDFRDAAIPLIKDIISRNHLPVIVGGSNFYLQALVSPFLFDDSVEELDEFCLTENSVDVANWKERQQYERGSSDYSHDHLRAVDPVAANRIHPNDHRKIRHYLEKFSLSGVLPSQLFQGKVTEKWGRLGGDSRYNCCFACVDAALPVLDQFVDQRVERMMEGGLLDEVYDIYRLNADYTRGLRQAIGVREFEDFLNAFISEVNNSSQEPASLTNVDFTIKQNLKEVLSSSNTPTRRLLDEAISKLKMNTRRLVRRQKRRINQLQTLFGWNIHFVDSTESLLGSSEDTWIAQVVEPVAKAISSFLDCDVTSVSDDADNAVVQKLDERDLWTQFKCEACSKVLRGAHEWEQHIQGRAHRKRIGKLKKRQSSFLTNVLKLPERDHLDSDV